MIAIGSFSIRDAIWPKDKPAALDFIMGAQHYEHAFEPNRRLDPSVAEEHLAGLLKDVARHDGKVLVADDANDVAIGWVVVHEQQDDVYVVSEERRFVYISELFVDEAWRGSGAGRALIATCEDLARSRNITVMQIGVLPGNHRAHGIYRRQGYADYGVQLRKYLR